MSDLLEQSAPEEVGARGYAVAIDLTGNSRFPEAYSAEVFGDWLNFEPQVIRENLASYYSVAVKQVGEPRLMTHAQYLAETEETGDE